MKRGVLLGVLLVIGACGGSGDAVLRATVGAESQGHQVTLTFLPSPLEYGADPWATHEVRFEIGTDDYVQTVRVHDRYAVIGNELLPAEGSTSSEYVLSDQGPFGGSFTVEVSELSAGEHRINLVLPVHLESSPVIDPPLEPRDWSQTIQLVYDVYWSESPLVEFCVDADQALWSEKEFDPELFADLGAAVLSTEDLARFEQAAGAYQENSSRGLYDPNQFFDLVEEICDVRYDERWMAMS